MKNFKNFLAAFDVVMVFVLAGLWAEKNMLQMVSSYMEREGENVPAMQTEQIQKKQGDTEEPIKIQEDTNYFELEDKKIAITFDDGPNLTYTPGLLQGLRERNVKATFFVIGKNAAEHPELIEEMKKDGHLIGNHTYNHIQLNASNRECSSDAGKVVETVLSQAEENSIILLHDQYDTSIAAAFAIIDKLKEEGYQFVTVDEILFD